MFNELKNSDSSIVTKLTLQALDEIVLRVAAAFRVAQPAIDIPFCVFNGGQDCWLDIGSKSVGVAQLQAYFQLRQEECLHVGDQVSWKIVSYLA